MDATFWTAFAAIATLATAIVTSIYTFYTGKMVKGELGPKLYVKGQVLKSYSDYDKSVNADIGFPSDYEKLGFVCNNAKVKWVLKIVNNGKSPASNIILKYSLILYKHHVEFNEQGLPDDEKVKLVVHKVVERVILVDYLPPNDENEQTVFFMDRFPFAKLQVNNLHCNEHKFITKNVNILDYFHPAFETIADSNDARALLGFQWAEKENTKVGASSV
jgi:hypothetical protein